MKKLLLAGIFAIALASTTRATLTALDSSNVTWTFVGSFRVSDGPAAISNPQVYSGIDAANLIFGAPKAGVIYAISTVGNFVTHTAHVDGVGDNQYMTGLGVSENFSKDDGIPGYNNPNIFGTPSPYQTAYSAYVADHIDYTVFDYVWQRSLNNSAIPEPSTFAAGALLALPFGLQGIRWLRNRRQAA